MELVQIEKLAEMLRKKRKRTGVKQKTVADRADLSPSQVNRIENNTVNPSYQAVYQLWSALEELEYREVENAVDLMNEPITWAYTDEKLEGVKKKMRENKYSQLPVSDSRDNPENIGRITREEIIEARNPDLKVEDIMGSSFMEVKETARKAVVIEILKEDPAVLVTSPENKLTGVITKSDLI